MTVRCSHCGEEIPIGEHALPYYTIVMHREIMPVEYAVEVLYEKVLAYYCEQCFRSVSRNIRLPGASPP